jgi:hypothetical protein
LGKPIEEGRRKASFDLGSDQAGLIQVIDVGFVLGAEARELHPDQVCQGDGADLLNRSAGA